MNLEEIAREINEKFENISKKEILISMTNITPNKEQIERIENVRANYKDIVDTLYQNCKESRELNIAITNLETSLMWAVKSIILNG
ncbi:MAG: hypothetical protein PHP92_05025 [Candidatus Nanoarchaeia archaeon]|nr:hypothetical protein [Candidatus Nanoarchaeia archaeon]